MPSDRRSPPALAFCLIAWFKVLVGLLKIIRLRRPGKGSSATYQPSGDGASAEPATRAARSSPPWRAAPGHRAVKLFERRAVSCPEDRSRRCPQPSAPRGTPAATVLIEHERIARAAWPTPHGIPLSLCVLSPDSDFRRFRQKPSGSRGQPVPVSPAGQAGRFVTVPPLAAVQPLMSITNIRAGSTSRCVALRPASVHST